MSRGIRIVFVLSLALNLLVVGTLAGAWLRHGPPDREFSSRGAIGKVLYRELSRQERRAMRERLRESVDRSVLRQMRVGPELDALLRAEPFEPEAVRVLMDRQARALMTGQNAMRDGWIEILSQMSPEGRQAYADRLKAALDRRHKGPPEDRP
jgi:uncharacterized membrane protein